MNKPAKNKFRVSVVLAFATVWTPILTIPLYIWFRIDGWDRYGEGASLWAEIIFLVMFVIFPIVMPILMFIVHWPLITVDEEGLHKSLFGKRLKSVKWEEIADIKTRSNLGGMLGTWIWFSKSILPESESFWRSYDRRDNISIMMNAEFYEAVKYYSGDIISTKTFPSLPAELVKKWEAEAAKNTVVKDIGQTSYKKSLAELAAEAKAERAEKPPPTENPWDKYK